MTDQDISGGFSPVETTKPEQNPRLSPDSEVQVNQSSGGNAIQDSDRSFGSLMQQQNNNGLHEKGKENNWYRPVDFVLSGKIWELAMWKKSWIWWFFVLAFIPSSMGIISVSILLKLPSAPNCPRIFWPLASASMRVHCATLAASKQTVSDLLQAIALVKDLPQDHPLRGQINDLLQEWSRDIINLAEKSFQVGNLEEAIATAKQIPENLEDRQFVEEKILKWQSTWSTAEEIYQSSIGELENRRWQSAFMLSSKLLRINNRFWSTTKYDQLNQIIVTAREDGDKLDKADSLADRNSVNDILAAIKLVKSVKPESFLYKKAQELVPQFGRKILKLAQAQMERRDADRGLEIAGKIPPIPSLQSEIDDFIDLGEAQRNAWLGTILGLENAISQAQQIDPSRGIYGRAQELISLWQLEIEDITKLEQARDLASGGTIEDLRSAISQAQQVPSQNPRAQEAQTQINRWNDQIETIQDKPYLDRAEQIANAGDINSLQNAIAEASQISSGRALYSKARRRIRSWNASIQRIEDQPYLDRAIVLAESGDLNSAVQEARKIAISGRALAGEAQAVIDTWQEQIRARENWRKARELASIGTADALSQAIRLANRVSRRNVLRMDINVAIDRWGEQILEIARSQSQVDLVRSIETARLVPRSSSAYADAQLQIRTWKEQLVPEVVPTTPLLSPGQPSL
ncbi:chromosome segregation ATPase [Cylindrospermopsis raciborskii CHAB3438]|uniref:chromosome segregation ATPase n=1 Tax=Cylindrospermopsis raciborskii TaxID=77022 RepID=UPI001F0FEEF1|nr:chromosome segregation ATPase [Cylindrospermopsis raciborskii]MCH4904331.1 chromosome segregation ATPase [Cylindrospermopsis raciborskii CHAB3438]MEB3145745.1 chromosome segregation ATPase [Cylindrospermopsis raciborskii]